MAGSVRRSDLGVVGVPALAVEVAEELGVVVGGDLAALRLGSAGGSTGGSLVDEATPLDHPDEQVHRQGEEGDEEQDLQHASRVGPGWSATTLIS